MKFKNVLRNVGLVLIGISLLCFLASCSTSEANSDKEALRILKSSLSDVKEISNNLKEFDKDTVKKSVIDNLEKRLNKVLANIHSTDRYKDLETIAPSYEMAMEQYDSMAKELQVWQDYIKERDRK